MTAYNKLVRDRIPKIIENSKLIAVTRRLDTREYVQALKSKLLEEATELVQASTKLETTAEAADIIEVLEALCRAQGIQMSDVAAMQEEKRAQRGGFDCRVYLIETKPSDEQP